MQPCKDEAMLRITVHDHPRAVTFQLEGALVGPWLQEFQRCCQSRQLRPSKSRLRVDLTGVTFIDDAGKACLAALHRQGAEFIAADCLMKAVVVEIAQESFPDADGRMPTAES
jgi:ABC-type transporter Mla MlaB component